MSQDSDRLATRVACLNIESVPFTLVSRLGFHCEVWRSIGRLVTPAGTTDMDFVLKVGKLRMEPRQVRVLAKEYRLLRDALDTIVPRALFVATQVGKHPGAVVFADTASPWFDLGNPSNEDEALPLLARQPRARSQLALFVDCARRWYEERRMVIDLLGGENLVLDRHAGVRYLDSFHAFLYLDTLDAIDDVDEGFLWRIEQCVARLGYLERLLKTSAA